MKEIAAEEIQDFDTSLDRLWARRDLVVLATGALICLRSIHRRAALIGALPRLRYAVISAEDYVLGTAEEVIRDAVRDAARLPGVRVVVLYLSCLDILVRPDFADIERSLTEETGCMIRCFFRGPLAKADALSHEPAEELLAHLPPEEGEVVASSALPPPMSDAAGVVDVLRGKGTAQVLVTPSGCRTALARMDLMPDRHDVYALIPHAEDYVFGMEETAAAEVAELAAEGRHRAIHLITSPVPAFMAMETAPILDAAEMHGCRGGCSPADGFHDGVFGVAEFLQHLVEEAATRWKEGGQTVLVLGYSPLLFGDAAALGEASAALADLGCSMVTAGSDALTERPAAVWLVSAAGTRAAAWLNTRYGIPVVRTLPLGREGCAAWRVELMGVLGRANDAPSSWDVLCAQGTAHPERILVVADPIAAAAIVRLLTLHGWQEVHCAAYAWSNETAELYRNAAERELLIFRTAEELQPAWESADIVVADPTLLPAMGEKRILPLPSGLLSGRDGAGAGSGVLGAQFAEILQGFLDNSKIMKC